MKTSAEWNRQMNETQSLIEQAEARGDFKRADSLREAAKLENEKYMAHKRQLRESEERRQKAKKRKEKSLLYNLFSIQGRLNRQPFILYLLFIQIVNILIISIQIPILGLLSLVLLISFLFQMIRRAQDTDRSGWYAFIPIYNIYLLFFVKGTEGRNSYGHNPLF